MRVLIRLLTAAVVTAAAIALIPLTASAETATGRDFGRHVASCAQSMGGFSAAHNPGMHQGFAGWDGSACIE